jgi:hypothetical protein
MTPSTRQALRLFHLASGIALAAFVYAPSLQASALFAALLQLGVVPALGLSGLWMWKPRLFRLRRA